MSTWGYVWVCLADEPPSFEEEVMVAIEERLGDLKAIEGYDVANLSLSGRIRYGVKANWKLIIENLECYHCATIHPELTEVLPEFAEGLDVIPGVGEDQDRRYYAITIKPTVFVNLLPDHVIIHRMFPMSADHTIVECDWLYLSSVVESGKDVTASVELFHRVNMQDFDACERCQPGMGSKTYAKGGVLVPSEHHIAAFHDWVQEKVGDIAQSGEVRMGLTSDTPPLEERAETLERYESRASRAS